MRQSGLFALVLIVVIVIIIVALVFINNDDDKKDCNTDSKYRNSYEDKKNDYKNDNKTYNNKPSRHGVQSKSPQRRSQFKGIATKSPILKSSKPVRAAAATRSRKGLRIINTNTNTKKKSPTKASKGVGPSKNRVIRFRSFGRKPNSARLTDQ